MLAANVPFVSGRRLLTDAVLIALAANLANLLDRAPGRAIKVGLLAWVPIAFVAGGDAVGIAIAPVIGAFCGLLGDDLREHLMLGDTGANVLGAVLGLAVVLDVGRGPRNFVLIGLILLTIAAEMVSFSAVIDRVPILRRFDALGRLQISEDTVGRSSTRSGGARGRSAADGGRSGAGAARPGGREGRGRSAPTTRRPRTCGSAAACATDAVVSRCWSMRFTDGSFISFGVRSPAR